MTSAADERARRLADEPFRSTAPVTGGATGGLIYQIRDIWRRRELLDMLIRRELKARYKDSTLGFLWSLMRPLAMLLIYYLALGKFLGAARQIPDFAIFIYTGLTAWGLFSETVTTATSSIVSNSGLIKKVYLPLSLAVLVVWALAWSLLLSAVNVFLRDVQYLVEIVLMIAFWLSPIVYSWHLVQSEVPSDALLQLYLANPATLAILGFQETFWVAGDAQPAPDNLVMSLWVALGVGAVFVLVAQRVFSRLQGNFAQEL